MEGEESTWGKGEEMEHTLVYTFTVWVPLHIGHIGDGS